MDLKELILIDKKNGVPDKIIGDKYGVNLKYIEKIITENTGVNISNISNNNKKTNKLSPKDFRIEKNTVWSFKSRGNWATHNGNFRGNWSPYIPRNVILKYSKEDDLVLDYFCGGGTTGIECKLLNRNFIGVDINPYAIELAKQNTDFDGVFKNLFPIEIKFLTGDARNLSFIKNNSVDLICSHPPYADIINYTTNTEGDLSHLKYDTFLEEIKKVADESFRVLKNKKYCAILIGDMRKNKMIVPLGFSVINKYLDAGFSLKELVIKRQHNCKTTGFWYTKSIKYNFFLLAHEYLAIFQKNTDSNSYINDNYATCTYTNSIKHEKIKPDSNILSKLKKDLNLETTTVWIFNHNSWFENTLLNLLNRYSPENYYISYNNNINSSDMLDLIIVPSLDLASNNIDDNIKYLKKDGILGIICEDLRLDNGLIYPQALFLEKKFKENKEIKLKEIIIISLENNHDFINSSNNLNITHKYLLVYQKN